MPDREKVIKGFEHCLGDHCEGCPYDGECEVRLYALEEDAIALLREDEKLVPRPARLMTQEEVLSQPEGAVVWREWRLSIGKYELRPMVCDGKGHCGDFGLSVECEYDFTYRHHVRYWTNRPTDEQREAVKWDAHD